MSYNCRRRSQALVVFLKNGRGVSSVADWPILDISFPKNSTMDDANRKDASDCMSAEDQAIAQEVDKAFRLYESTIQVAKFAASLEKEDEPWPRDYTSFVFPD